MFAQMFTGEEHLVFLVSGFTLQLLFAGGLCCCFSLICFWFLELSQQNGEKIKFLPFLLGGRGRGRRNILFVPILLVTVQIRYLTDE